MGIIVSPTEPEQWRKAASTASVSMLPEKYGCDAIWRVFADDPIRSGWSGVQRKELSDLLSSVRDGRLGQQLRQMSPLRMAMVVIEGRWRWSTDGELQIGSRDAKPWTKKQVAGILWSVQAKGVWVYFTETLGETISAVEMFADWSSKDNHSGLDSRGGPEGDGWGRLQRRDWQRHLLTGFPGIGGELATRILDVVGMPLGGRWEDTREALMQVPGLGKKKVDGIMDVLEGDNDE